MRQFASRQKLEPWSLAWRRGNENGLVQGFNIWVGSSLRIFASGDVRRPSRVFRGGCAGD